MILMNYIWKKKVVTAMICGLCGSKASGKTMLEVYVGVKVREVYMQNSIMPFRERMVDLAHEKTKMVEGVVVFWPSKFPKLVGV
jgi:phosphoenolpyruvate-protein kinase (PTS system EI component)